MILAGNGNMTVGSAEVFTLNRAELSGVISDNYYKDTALWKEVLAVFQKEGGSLEQRAILSYEGSDEAILRLSTKAKPGTWKLYCITVKDFDHGHFTVVPKDIPNSNLYFITVTQN